jgi:hypothetical protein
MALNGFWKNWFKSSSRWSNLWTRSPRPYRRRQLLEISQLEDRILMTGGLPDLFVTQADAPASAIVGEKIAVTRTIINQGEGGTPDRWFDAVYLSDDTVFHPQTDLQLNAGFVATQYLAVDGCGEQRR